MSEFVQVPVALAKDNGLSPRARAVAVLLLSLVDRNGYYLGGMTPLTDAALGSERVIRNAFAELEANGYLERQRMAGGRMSYRVHAEGNTRAATA